MNSFKLNSNKIFESFVIIPLPISSMFLAIDESIKHLKAIHPVSKKAMMSGVLKEFFPEIITISDDIIINNHIVSSLNSKRIMKVNLQKLLEINPDVICYWDNHIESKELINCCNDYGIKILLFRWSIEFDFVPTWFKIIGSILKKEEKAEKLILWREESIQIFKKAVLKIPIRDKLRTIELYRYYKIYKIYRSGCMILLQANYPEKEMRKKDEWIPPKIVTARHILNCDPEIIFLHTFEEKARPEDLYYNLIFKNVSAVKNKRVYKMPETTWYQHEAPLSWMWMAMILYPDYFNFDLRKEIKTWYKIMYRRIPSKKQIDNILRINMNKDSKNYERFF